MEAARGEGGERFSSVDERRLDAGFFQQGHGRMDVGIMEASTVPSLPDKNCRWKEDGGEGDEGRISRRGGGRGRGGKKSRGASGKRKAKRREIERGGEREEKRESNGAAGRDRWKDSTRDEEFRYALSSTVGRIKISSRRWRLEVHRPRAASFLRLRETRTPTEYQPRHQRPQNSPRPRPVLASWLLQFCMDL